MASSTLFERYIEADTKVAALFSTHFANTHSRREVVQQIPARSLSAGVKEALISINQALPVSQKRENNLARLADSNTVFLLTGQQTGLFAGPVFTLYKCLTAEACAEHLEIECGRPVVPVFWLQTEDHDYQEVSRVSILNREATLTSLALPPRPRNDERKSVKYSPLPPEITQLKIQLRELIGHFPNAPWALDIIEQNYKAGTSLSEAFARTLAGFLEHEGILLFDPRHPAVFQESKSTFETAFRARDAIEVRLQERVELLEQLSLAPQVKLIDHSPLFFFAPDTDTNSDIGPRFRMQQVKGGRFQLIGDERTFSENEILQFLALESARFSSSALLRPLLEATLFPSAGYVGGPAEIQYLAQIAPVYELFGLQQPLIIPRARAVVIDSKIDRLLGELRLTAGEILELSHHEVMRRIAENNSSPANSPSALREQTQSVTNDLRMRLRDASARADITLEASVDKAFEKISYQLGQIIGRYERALALKDETSRGRLERVYQFIKPEGTEQERAIAGIYFLSCYGRTFLDAIKAKLTPFSGERVTVAM